MDIHTQDPVEILKSYVACPSVSTDPSFAEGMDQARDFVRSLLDSLGFKTEILQEGGKPSVFAERFVRDGLPTVLVYGHYDVQPTDPDNLWDTKPFEGTVKNGKLYARGACDNKGPQLCQLLGLARALKANPDLPVNIKVFIEGEEEIGSPTYAKIVAANREKLTADYVLISDTASPSVDQVAITTGVRGLISLDCELRGPSSDLHSGAYGGAVVNPIQALTKLCASLHDDNGRITVPGFYDGVQDPADWELEQIAKIPGGEGALKDVTGVPELWHPAGVDPMVACRLMPTIEYNGIMGGYQGDGHKTIIPSFAKVKMTCRLVAGQDAQDVTEKLKNFLKQNCPKGVTIHLHGGDEGGNAYSVNPPHLQPGFDPQDASPLARGFMAVDKAVEESFGRKPIYIKDGGSIHMIEQTRELLGMDSILLGFVTPGSNLHAPNEYFQVELLERGIDTYKRIFLGLAQ